MICQTDKGRRSGLTKSIIMLIISITGTMFFALIPYYLQYFLVYAQVDLLESSTQTESVTSTYDALLKAPMIISQAAIVGAVFNHLFLQRVLRSRIQPNYKNKKPLDTNLQP